MRTARALIFSAALTWLGVSATAASGGAATAGSLRPNGSERSDAFADAAAARVIRHALDAEHHGQVVEALKLFREADAAKPNDPFILQKISKQLSDSTDDVADSKQRLELAEEALDYSKRAASLAPKEPVNLVSLAVCYGHLAHWGDNRTRVEASRLVKDYAEQALALDPNSAWAHHVLGFWHEEVAKVGGPTRAMARIFYGGLPEGSMEEAIAHLRKAVELQPTQAAHHVALGLAYWNSGDKIAGRAELEKGLSLAPQEKHDITLQRQARAILKE